MNGYHPNNLSTKLLLMLLYSVGTSCAATFIVTKTTDHFPTGQQGELRWAIQQSNQAAGTNTINFNIPGSGPFVIQPVQDLDPITKPVVINGYSQPGATQNTLASSDNANILIQLSGNNYTEGNSYVGTGNGLTFAAGSQNSIVKGLAINAWVNNGVYVNAVNFISILGCFIGTNATGTQEIANQTGIYIASSNNITIGSTSPADRNIIAGSFFFFNGSASIVLSRSSFSKIVGNYIGTDKTGTSALGNSLVGIACLGGGSNNIGSNTLAGRNIISGHTVAGIFLASTYNVTIAENYIGTDVSGSFALPNANYGIFAIGNGAPNATTNNVIKNNIISGNRVGIRFGSEFSLGTNNNTIIGNNIGTDSTGSLALGNDYGIIINDNANTIGSSLVQERNVISGNSIGGILLYGEATNNVIKKNYIGLDISGTLPLANGYGIQVGLSGGLVTGSNTIQNNSFGGGNHTSKICLLC